MGKVTTENDVTTVVNESGSIWGSDVSVEETLSIGVESGDAAYLLGDVRDIAASSDRIYIADTQLDRIRVYDHGGTHLFDVGGSGGGPGELSRPSAIGVDFSERLIVQDYARVSVFDLDGAFIEAWPYRSGGFPLPLVPTEDGTTFVPWLWIEGGERYHGLLGISPDGSEGRRITAPDFDPEPWALTATSGSNVMQGVVPYAAAARFSVLPSGAVVRGISNTYEVQIEHADGSLTVIERVIDPAPVSNEEKEWQTKIWMKRMRSTQPDWSWDVNPVPAYKPAFDRLFGDRYGRLWVRRIVRTVDVPDCVQDPTVGEDLSPRSCWQDVFGFDVFEEATGRFLGGIEVPEKISLLAWPAFVQDGLLVAVEDDAGIIRVKKYRLSLPRDADP